MAISISQKNKIEQLCEVVNILFYEDNLGLLSSEAKDVWVVGDTVRDFLLFQNPPISTFDFYIQTESLEFIYNWFSRLKDKNVQYVVDNEDFLSNNEDTPQVLEVFSLSLLNYGIETEIKIIVGKDNPQTFINDNYSIGLSLVGIDVSDIGDCLENGSGAEGIFKKIWRSEQFRKDFKTQKITVLNQEWMKNREHYNHLQGYLEKTHAKLSLLGFN